jgi:CRP-like cAMP-binding protein
MGQDLTEVIKLLQVPPESRRPFQVLQLVQHTSDIKFFKKITEEQQSNKIHISCCQALTYKEFGVDEFIFNYGDEGTFFCIILQGLVRVLVPKPPEAPEEEPLKEPEKLEKSQLNLGLGLLKNTIKAALKPIIMSKVEELTDTSRSGFTHTIEDNKNLISQEDLTNQEESTSIEVASLGAGTSFGELALLRDATRAASIQCVEPSIVAILSKSDYKRILGSFQEKQINDKIEYLYGLPPFKKWSKVSLMKLSYYFTEKEVRKGTVLYKEGDELTNVYIIKSGEFKVLIT